MLPWVLPFAAVLRLTVFGRQREGAYSDSFAVIDGSALAAIIIVGLTFLSLLVQRRTLAVLQHLRTSPYGLLAFFYCFCAASALWSPMPKYTLFRAAEVLSQLVAVAVALYYCSNFARAEKTVITVATMVLMLAFFNDLKNSGYLFSIEGLHTNLYSQIAAMLLCYSLGEVFASVGERRPLLWITAGVSFAALVAGTSASSNIGAACGLIAIGLAGPAGLRLVAVLTAVAFCFGYALLGEDRITSLLQGGLAPGKDVEQIEGLTGRRTLWEGILADRESIGMLGRGFSSAAKTLEHSVNSAHNFLLDIFLGCGVVGVLLICLFLLVHYAKLFARVVSGRTGGVGLLGASVAATVNSLGAPVFGSDWTAATCVYACFLMLGEISGETAARQPARRASRGRSALARRAISQRR